mmetsp:Transcript_6783/g.14023  ORF Transcript_6783/g.14023 Transcript_6783/m.14023 type:complete len:216 (-) Transcript_6783:335-982(-)
MSRFPRCSSSANCSAQPVCCTAAITTSCMLLKTEGTDSKIRPFSRTFFKTLSLVSKFSSRRPGCSFRSASSTRKLSTSLNRSTDPCGNATREKVDVESEAAEAASCSWVFSLASTKVKGVSSPTVTWGQSPSAKSFTVIPRANQSRAFFMVFVSPLLTCDKAYLELQVLNSLPNNPALPASTKHNFKSTDSGVSFFTWPAICRLHGCTSMCPQPF